MRQRKLKWADEYLATTPYIVREYPVKLTGNEELEIGCGKGKFIRDKAKASPDNFFYGLEIQSSCLAISCKKAAEEELGNVKFCYLNAMKLRESFDGYFKNIYLNFSDPWPKAKHEKRRLTSFIFRPIYASLLQSGGKVIFRTDNKGLFDYSVEQFKEDENFKILEINYDTKLVEGEIISEYETKFRNLGNPIYKLLLERK